MGYPVATKPRTLDVAFQSQGEFEREYEINIANGGIFVETEDAFEIREKVEVSLKLLYIKKGIALKGEVVHVVGPMARGSLSSCMSPKPFG